MLTNLKKLRKERKLSQQELAEILGLSQQSINKYENHDVQPDFHTLKKMADFFQTSVDYLIGHNEVLSVASNDGSCFLTAAEVTLLKEYRSLNDSQKSCLHILLKTWIE